MRPAFACGWAVTAAALVALAVMAEDRGHARYPWLDLAIGCVLLLSGMVAGAHSGTRRSGVALLLAGATWFLDTAGLTGPFGGDLTYLHRGLVLAAVVLASGRRWMGARIGVIALALVASMSARASSSGWCIAASSVVVVVVALDVLRTPSRLRFAVMAGAGIALWTFELIWLVPRNMLDAFERNVLYGLGLALCAVAVAARDRLSGTSVRFDLVRDFGPRSVRVGFRDAPGEPYHDITGAPLDVPERDRTIVVPAEVGDTVLVLPEGATAGPKVRASLIDAALMLRAHHDALVSHRHQLESIAASEARIRTADELASLEVAQELERLVVTPLEHARRSLTGHDPDGWGRALTEIVDDVRAVARGLEPPALTGGLGPALMSLASHATVPVTVQTTSEPVDPVTALTLFFVASETVTNAVRHGAPNGISVRTTVDQHEVVMTVTDDGRGSASIGDDGGLAGLRRRLEAAGGALEVSEREGGGTVVTARLHRALDGQPTRVHSKAPSPATS